jgi:hypothetical protein
MAELVELHARILAAVSAKRWRGEISLCLEFGGAKTHAPTEDALFALVQAGQLEWFGDNSRPLRYRVPREKVTHV